MKVYLLDINPKMTAAWKAVFGDTVTIVTDDFKSFIDHTEVQAVVSPANSRGIMSGGYNLAISEHFGWQLTKNVQRYIANNYPNSQQPVGTSIIFDIPNTRIKLIHTPTMNWPPRRILDPNIIYQCTKSALACAKYYKIECIVIPAFGGLTGRIDLDLIANLMYRAYKEEIGK